MYTNKYLVGIFFKKQNKKVCLALFLNKTKLRMPLVFEILRRRFDFVKTNSKKKKKFSMGLKFIL